MTDNDYVATAAAEKRLREVLADKLGRDYDIDEIADTLLSGTKIEYKSRAKQVTISLDLPDTAATKTPKQDTEPVVDTADTDGTPNVQAPPQPHIAPFVLVIDADADYEDVHYD